jgi:hypothetical protein
LVSVSTCCSYEAVLLTTEVVAALGFEAVVTVLDTDLAVTFAAALTVPGAVPDAEGEGCAADTVTLDAAGVGLAYSRAPAAEDGAGRDAF